MFNFFKPNKLNRVISELKNNNLIIMAGLLESASKEGYNNIDYSIDRKNLEVDTLKKMFDLKRGPAIESLNRFKWAKEICENNDLIEGVRLFDNYIDIYNIYIKKYCD